MQGSWLDFFFAFAVAAILIYVPGLVLANSIRLRGFTALALAPVLSIGSLSTLGVVFAFAGIRWTPSWFAIATIAVAGALFVLSGLFKTKNPTEYISIRQSAIPILVALIAGAVLLARTLYSLKVPYAITQTYDGNYHYNNVVHMLTTGNISSVHMLQLPPNSTFYPASWHGFVTTIVQLTGVSIPVAANAFTYFVMSFVWPLSMIAFGLCFSRNKVFLTTLATISTLVSFFPGIYLWFGMLYANTVAISFLPAVLMAVIAFLFNQRLLHLWQTLFIGAVSFVALIFSQPNGIFTVYYVVLIALPFAAYKFGKAYNEKHNTTSMHKKLLAVAIVADILFEVLVGLASYYLKTLHNLRFDFDVIVNATYGYKSALMAFASATIDGYNGSLIPYLHNLPVALLLFFGAFLLLFIKREKYWVVIAWLWFSFINFVAAGLPQSYFRAYISGAYYAEKMRLVSIQAIFMLIIITFALTYIFEKLHLVKVTKKKQQSITIATVISLAVIFIGGQFVPEYSKQFKNVEITYGMPKDNFENNALYSQHELDFMSKTIPDLDKNSTIIANPWKGGSATWFLYGKENLMYHVAYPTEKNRVTILKHLNQADTDPAVCPAVKKLKLRYVLDISGSCLWGWGCDSFYEGLANLDNSKAVKLIDKDKYGNKLYEVTACN